MLTHIVDGVSWYWQFLAHWHQLEAATKIASWSTSSTLRRLWKRPLTHWMHGLYIRYVNFNMDSSWQLMFTVFLLIVGFKAPFVARIGAYFVLWKVTRSTYKDHWNSQHPGIPKSAACTVGPNLLGICSTPPSVPMHPTVKPWWTMMFLWPNGADQMLGSDCLGSTLTLS